jgi:hypothetical protein
MHDISTSPQFTSQYGQPQLGAFAVPQAFGLPPFGASLPGFVPIVSLVPQGLIVSLVVQSLQQAQGHFGLSGQLGGLPFGAPPFGSPPFGSPPFGLPQLGSPVSSPQQLWASPWQTTMAGQTPYAGAIGRGILGHQPTPYMSYTG